MAEVARTLGVAEQTLSVRRQRFRGQNVDEIKEMEPLVTEHAKPRKLVAGIPLVASRC